MKYVELREKHQKEYNEFPLGYAFTNEQFDKMMENWGLDPKRDLDKIIGFKSVCGGFIQKKDVEPYRKMVEKINQEMTEALKNDDFFKEACLEEFFNHELCYNHWQGHYDVLTALSSSNSSDAPIIYGLSLRVVFIPISPNLLRASILSFGVSTPPSIFLAFILSGVIMLIFTCQL